MKIDNSTATSYLALSPLSHTWLIDIDGTIAVHNGYLADGEDTPLENSCAFLRGLPRDDVIILLTSRQEAAREKTENFLKKNNIRYDKIIFDLPVGERILINDNKPSGLCMAHTIALSRNEGINCTVEIDEKL